MLPFTESIKECAISREVDLKKLQIVRYILGYVMIQV